MLKRYLYNILISIDQLGNTLLFGNPDETISSRVGRNRLKYPIIEYMIDSLFEWVIGEKNHCQNSIEKDGKHEPTKE